LRRPTRKGDGAARRIATIDAVATITGRAMPARFPVRFLAALALACGGVAHAGPAPKPAAADIAAFEKALPTPGHDRAFLALAPELEARLGVDPAVLRAVDPGVACDSASPALRMSEGDLGTAGHVQTSCSPDHHSQSLLTLADGSAWVTVCGAATGTQVRAWVDVTVGDSTVHASTQAPARHEPAHDCSGWTKIPH
jgi:hypothetical protein